MIKQGTGGSIVFTASIAGQMTLLRVPLLTAAYSFSKAGLLQLKSSSRLNRVGQRHHPILQSC